MNSTDPILCDANFEHFAARHYENTACMSVEEFYDDLKRFQYIKRLFRKYETGNPLRARLVLNHIVVLYNCFGPQTTPMLFLKLEQYHSQLIPFLTFIHRLPETVSYNGKTIATTSIPVDPHAVRAIRESVLENPSSEDAPEE